VQALDRIETLPVELAGRHPGPSLLRDDGRARARVTAPRWAEYVELGLMEIRRYGADSPQVARRLHAVYDRPCEVVGDGERARVDLERRLLAEAVAGSRAGRRARAGGRPPDARGLRSLRGPRRLMSDLAPRAGRAMTAVELLVVAFDALPLPEQDEVLLRLQARHAAHRAGPEGETAAFIAALARVAALERGLRVFIEAGDRGVEPRVAVLETAVLPIHQSPAATGF
jgi:hypothetical protein